MDSFADTPFAALTIIVAPAILTNASSVLCLGTTNRIARVVDRTRVLGSALGGLDPASPLAVVYGQQLDQLKVRAHLLLGALRWLYASIGSFAAAALVSIIGTVLASAETAVFQTMAALGLISGTVGVAGLVIGCVLMVRETQLAVRFLEHEAQFIRGHPQSNHQQAH
jgi:hypothetical protein